MWGDGIWTPGQFAVSWCKNNSAQTLVANSCDVTVPKPRRRLSAATQVKYVLLQVHWANWAFIELLWKSNQTQKNLSNELSMQSFPLRSWTVLYTHYQFSHTENMSWFSPLRALVFKFSHGDCSTEEEWCLERDLESLQLERASIAVQECEVFAFVVKDRGRVLGDSFWSQISSERRVLVRFCCAACLKGRLISGRKAWKTREFNLIVPPPPFWHKSCIVRAGLISPLPIDCISLSYFRGWKQNTGGHTQDVFAYDVGEDIVGNL